MGGEGLRSVRKVAKYGVRKRSLGANDLGSGKKSGLVSSCFVWEPPAHILSRLGAGLSMQCGRASAAGSAAVSCHSVIILCRGGRSQALHWKMALPPVFILP